MFHRARPAGVLLGAAMLAAVLVAGAGARRATDPSVIVVDRSIGGVSIGASESEVRARYGAPQTSFAMAGGSGEAGAFQAYKLHGGLLAVALAGGKVVGVLTDSRYYHTAPKSSWGPGSLLTSVHGVGGAKLHTDFCSGGLTTQRGSSDVTTIVIPTVERVQLVWITKVDYYTLCSAQSEEPPPPPSEPFPLSVSVDPTGDGYVQSDPRGIDCPLTCAALFPAGTSVTLSAHAGEGFAFTGWSGDCTGATDCTVDMTASRSVVAHFTGGGPAEPGGPPPPPHEPTGPTGPTTTAGQQAPPGLLGPIPGGHA